MKQQITKTFTLDSKEVKEAIRRFFISEFGTEMKVFEKDIELYQSGDDIVATIKVNETP